MLICNLFTNTFSILQPTGCWAPFLWIASSWPCQLWVGPLNQEQWHHRELAGNAGPQSPPHPQTYWIRVCPWPGPQGLGGTYTLLTWGCLGFEEEGTSLAKCSDPSGYVFVWGWGWNQKRMGQLQGWLEGGQYKTPLSFCDPESTVRPANKRSRQRSNYQPYHR